MSDPEKKQSAWREGPAKWVFTAYGILLASVHLALAGFDVGKFFDLFEIAWPFYAALIGITSTAAVAIHRSARRQSAAAALVNAVSPAAYVPPGAELEEETYDLPRPPR